MLFERNIGNNKRVTAQEYAKALYPQQKTWQEIAKTAYLDGENNAIFVIRKTEYNKILEKLEDLKRYKRETEELLNDPDRLSEYIGGL